MDSGGIKKGKIALFACRSGGKSVLSLVRAAEMLSMAALPPDTLEEFKEKGVVMQAGPRRKGRGGKTKRW